MSEQWEHIVNFLIYLGVTLPLLGLGMLLFMITTPYREARLLAQGASATPEQANAAKAAAYDLGGKIVGHAIVLASAVFHSVGLLDLIVWGVLGAVFQVIVYYVFELLTPYRVRDEIPAGNVAVGIFSSRFSLAAGLLMAALISY